MPAIAETDEAWPIGDYTWERPVGAALWPSRYRVDELTQISRSRGPYWWAALYQQRPQPLGGGKFKDEGFRYYHMSPDSTVFVLHDPSRRRSDRRGGEVLGGSVRARSRVVAADACGLLGPEHCASSRRKTISSGAICRRARLEGPDQLPAIRAARSKSGT